MNILDRFLNYVKIDTMSSEDGDKTPSTKKQFNLAKILVKELKELGLKDASVDDYAVVTATLEANSDTKDDCIGFNAHLDTIPGFSGTNVNPQIIKKYNGNDIKLKNNVTIDKKTFPFMPKFIGKTLITTNGTTVLGADDKAGIAIIMSMLDFFFHNPSVKHTKLKIAFTPDEEIGGGGIDHLDLSKFKCDYAYTIDGGASNEINYECFNASSALVTIKGLDIHPGSAKGKMINAIDIATEFNQMLPKKEKPMYTDNYQGFNHLCMASGEVGWAKMEYILRNHDLGKLAKQKEMFKKIADKLIKKYGNVIVVEITDSYRNMKESIDLDRRSIDRATKAMKSLNINPEFVPIRGGTDGAKLTARGLNTPNLGTGGYNCHGPYEFACLQEMEDMVRVLIEIAKIKRP